MRMKRGWLALGAVTVLLAGGWLFRGPLGELAFGRMVEARAGLDVTAALPDGLHLILCGSGSPLPDPTRAGPCAMVIAGEQSLLFDAGEGGARNLTMMGVGLGRLDRVFLTHFHSDHIDGMGPVMLQRWVGAGATTPLPVHGPPGVETVVAGFNMAYGADNGYRTAHHGAGIAPPGGAGAVALPFPAPGAAPRLVYSRAGLRVEAFSVDHSPVEPAMGYRLRYKGRSLVISGDTSPSDAVVAAAKGADLLVHEALQPQLLGRLTSALEAKGQAATAQITRDILDYHTSPAQAAAIAAAAGVEHLVLTHIVPAVPGRWLEAAFLGDASQRFEGVISVGRDGMMFSLPAGGSDIIRKDLL